MAVIYRDGGALARLSLTVYFDFCICSAKRIYYGNVLDLRYVCDGDASRVDRCVRSVCIRTGFYAGGGICARIPRFIGVDDTLDVYALSSCCFGLSL